MGNLGTIEQFAFVAACLIVAIRGIHIKLHRDDDHKDDHRK